MFHIYLDDKKMHIPDWQDNNKIVFATLEEELNKAGQFIFKLPLNHIHYNAITPLLSRIRVFDDSDLIFKGRPINQGFDFKMNKTVKAEGEFSYFSDSVFQASLQGEYSSTYLIPAIIENHNSMVDENKRFNIGIIEPNNIIIPDRKFYKTMDFLKNVIVKNHGGYFKVRYDNNENRYIDYVMTPGIIDANTTIEYGVNLLDFEKFIDTTELYTCIIPCGDVDKNSGCPLDIKDVNGGQIYVENVAAVQKYGKIFRTVEIKGAPEAETLLSIAGKFADSAVAQAVTLNLTALEMRRIDFRNPESLFVVGNSYKVKAYTHGVNDFFLCSKKKTDLFLPENNKVQLGWARKSLTDYLFMKG